MEEKQLNETCTKHDVQATGIKKSGLLLDLNCLPSQVARLIVRGFSRGRILLFARFLSLGLWQFPLSFSLSLSFFFSLLFFSYFFLFRFPRSDPSRFHKPRLGTPRSRTFRSRNNSTVPKFSLPPLVSPLIGIRVVCS